MIKLYTYRYLLKTTDAEQGEIGVKIVTDTADNLAELEKKIFSDPSVKSCLKEYLHEIDLSFLGLTETVKKEESHNASENS